MTPTGQSRTARVVVVQLAAGHSVAALRAVDARRRLAGRRERTRRSPRSKRGRARPTLPALLRRPRRCPGPTSTALAAHLDAGDRRVQVLQTLRHPRVVVFGDLLSDDECEALVAAAASGWPDRSPSRLQTGGETLNVDRTSDGTFFERGENAIVARLEQRIAHAAALAAGVRRRPAGAALCARRAVPPALRLFRPGRARHAHHPAPRRPARGHAGDVPAGARARRRHGLPRRRPRGRAQARHRRLLQLRAARSRTAHPAWRRAGAGRARNGWRPSGCASASSARDAAHR